MLLGRHGPMVLDVCRQVLRDPDDAEDAFQATFLALVCKASGCESGIAGSVALPCGEPRRGPGAVQPPPA